MLPLYNNLLILVKLSSIMLSLSQITMISYDSVFHSFHSACFGINAGVQQLAMKQIQEYENYVGFIDSIVKIISSGESIQYEIRLLASISLKNIVGSRWISRRANMQTVNESEKQLLRSFSIQYYGESDKRISLQLAILASKIARHDWPNSWPDLFPELLQIIHANQSNLPNQKQALIITYEIIRELHEKKMPNVRQGLLIASPLVFSSIVPLWGACIDAIITNPTYISPQLITSIGSYDLEILLEHLYILTKILRCLIEESYEIISVQIDMNSFFPSFVSSMQRLVEYVLAYYNSLTNDGKLLYHDREPDINDDIFAFSTLAASLNSCHNSSSSNTFRTTATSDHNSTTTTNSTTNFTSSVAPSSGNRFVLIIIPMLKRLVYEMSLIPVRIQKENPIEFIPFLAPFLDFFSRQLMLQYQSDPSSGVLNTHPSNYSFCINIVLFLSNTLSCTSYHPTSASGTNEGEDTFGSSNFGGTVSYSTKSVISDSSATSAITTSNDNNTVTTMGISIRDEFFNDLSISSILDIILQRLLRYHRLELFEWSENPEQFYLSQEDLSESESLRISSEQLFLGILEKNPGLVCSKIVNYLQNIELQNIQLLLPYSSDTNTSTVSNSSSLQSTSTYSSSSYEVDDAVMFWNSVYLCTGLSASTLSQGMNASQWLASSIGPLLTEILSKATSRSLLGSLSTGQQILTTRLFWLLSCWMYYFDSDLIPQILHLINLAFDDSRYIDEVCILTAMETLQSILKCTNFKPPEHVSYLLPILNSVWTVMTNKLSENESRSTAVQTISMMIDFISCEYLLPVLDSMLSQLNEIWLDCEDSSPLRISLLDVSYLYVSVYVRVNVYLCCVSVCVCVCIPVR